MFGLFKRKVKKNKLKWKHTVQHRYKTRSDRILADQTPRVVSGLDQRNQLSPPPKVGNDKSISVPVEPEMAIVYQENIFLQAAFVLLLTVVMICAMGLIRKFCKRDPGKINQKTKGTIIANKPATRIIDQVATSPPSEHDNENVSEDELSEEEFEISSDFQNDDDCEEFHKTLLGFYTSLIKLVNSKDFDKFIKETNDCIRDELTSRKDDINTTDCPIVIAGETSSGKSTIINLIVGEKVVPTKVTASTTRVCRIRHSETMSVSTWNEKGNLLKTWPFEEIHQLAEILKGLAKTEDPNIFYVDIEMPVPMIQGNVTIVDTPGIGDDDQEDVARRMMNYLQDALAVVFIINVANAGGVQNDRLVRIIKHIRDSMTGKMFCFSPEDTLFVLNKWDSIEDDDENEEFFESTKTKLQTIWKEVDDRHILKLSAVKALKQSIYKTMFANFKRTLQEVITKNKNKRIEVHLQFLKSFLDKYTEICSTKLEEAEQEMEEICNKRNLVQEEISKREKVKQQADNDRPRIIDRFLEVVTDKLYQHINREDFKCKMFKGTEKITRFYIETELNSHINKEIIDWQNANVRNIFQTSFNEKIRNRFSATVTRLRVDDWKTDTMPRESDKGDEDQSGILSITKLQLKLFSTISLVIFGFFSILIVSPSLLLERFFILILLILTLLLLGYLKWNIWDRFGFFIDNFDKYREKAFQKNIRQFSKGKLKENVSEMGTNVIENEITTLMRTLQKDIDNLKMKECTILEDYRKCDVKKVALLSFKKKISRLNASFIHIENM